MTRIHKPTAPSTRMFAILLASVFSLAPPAWAHGPDQVAHQIADLGKFRMEGGGVIEKLRMSYVTHGKLNRKKSNAILVMHGFGANHHLADVLIGPGMAFDTDKYFVIASDTFGNTQTEFEHSTSATNTGMNMDFPAYNTRDMVNAEHRLVTKGLGIKHLVAVSGISVGAEKTIQFAVSYPDFVDKAIPIVGGALWSSQGFFTFTQLPMTIEHCAGWNNGDYERNPKECAATALMALVPSFYSREWWNENITTPDAFKAWWAAQYDGYLGVQDARDLYLFSAAVVRSTVAHTPGFDGDLGAALGAIQAKTVFIVSPYDAFIPPQYVEMQKEMIAGARIVTVDRNSGHLIFSGEDQLATEAVEEAIKEVLSEGTEVAAQ